MGSGGCAALPSPGRRLADRGAPANPGRDPGAPCPRGQPPPSDGSPTESDGGWGTRLLQGNGLPLSYDGDGRLPPPLNSPARRHRS
jgi:hypothetical protein